jgi:hypothetical protein
VDWREFYESDEFRAYRLKVVEEIGTYTYGMVSHAAYKTESGALLKGALDMAYKIIQLPLKSTNDPKQQARYQDMIQQDMARVAELIIGKRMANGV